MYFYVIILCLIGIIVLTHIGIQLDRHLSEVENDINSYNDIYTSQLAAKIEELKKYIDSKFKNQA